MRVRVNSVFLTRFNEAIRDMEAQSPTDIVEKLLCTECDEPWEPRNGDKCECGGEGSYVSIEQPSVPRQVAVEEFLTRMAPDLARVLKHQLLDELLRETAAREAVENVNNPKLNLDTAPAL
jgi:hypothetical protein